MSTLKLTGKELLEIGFPQGKAVGAALEIFNKHYKYYAYDDAVTLLKKILAQPEGYLFDETLGPVANALILPVKSSREIEIPLRGHPVPFQVFGEDFIDPEALRQMNTASRLPVSRAGALMPDAHSGYGLPIGGVLATENAVIPYGVGVDIGCRMCLSVFPVTENELQVRTEEFKRLLLKNTRFGAGGEFSGNQNHPVLEKDVFDLLPFLKTLQGKAMRQLGTSGSGNHFAEFGILEVLSKDAQLALPPGKYIALLTHSGSRGLGAGIARYYTKIAKEKRNLPREAAHLSWLNLDEQEGMEYWMAMNLAGEYASACHHVIHEKISKALGEKPVTIVENHHNFAWKEIHEGKELIVHRKGATPAGEKVLGIIPGSMTLPGFVVKGKGKKESLASASHGAGRAMSRTQAKKNISVSEMRQTLEEHGVLLIGGGLDEAPQAYKNIYEVMNAQKDLVETLALFHPKIVRMDDH